MGLQIGQTPPNRVLGEFFFAFTANPSAQMPFCSSMLSVALQASFANARNHSPKVASIIKGVCLFAQIFCLN